MSQLDICKVLKNKLLSGDDRFFSSVDIVKMLIYSNVDGTNDLIAINKQLNRLVSWGIVQTRIIDNKKHYRYKKSRLDDINI